MFKQITQATELIYEFKQLDGSVSLKTPLRCEAKVSSFLLYHFESTNELSYQSLVDFVNKEKALKSTEFGFMIMRNESEHTRTDHILAF